MKFLLLRSRKATLGAGKWGLPAGKINDQEKPFDAALREMDEEIGSNHSVSLTRKAGPVIDSFYGQKFEIFLFQYKWINGTIKLNHEHTAFQWVKREEISTMNVMLGVEEDLAILEIWPVKFLNKDRLPKAYLANNPISFD